MEYFIGGVVAVGIAGFIAWVLYLMIAKARREVAIEAEEDLNVPERFWGDRKKEK